MDGPVSDTLTPDVVLRLFQGNPAAGVRTARLVRLTLTINADSRQHSGHLLPLFGEDRTAPPTYADLYLAHSRWQGQQLWAHWQKLLPGQFSQLDRRVQFTTGAVSWGLAEALCEGSRQLASTNRPLAVQVAHLAVALAERVPLDPLGPSARSELLALAHATVANALRAQDQTRLARRILDDALSHLEGLESYPLGLLSSILSLKGTQEVWERDYTAALTTLATALDLCPQDQRSLRARILIKRSTLRMYQEDYSAAAKDLEEVAARLRPDEEPCLWSMASLNRVLILTHLKRWREAEALLPQVEKELSQGDSVHLLYLRWGAARLARGQDRDTEAESLYLEAREGFLRHQLPYGAAVVTLELAHLLFDQGRLEQVKQYALETAVEFQRQGVEPELVGALALLEEAATAQRLTIQLLERIRRSIERRNRP